MKLKQYSTYIFLILLLILSIYKSLFINIFSNVNKYLLNNKGVNNVEINLLKEKNKVLSDELKKLTDYKVDNMYNYEITRLSYRKSYTSNEFYIYGDKYIKNAALINKDGLVGIIKKVSDGYSECMMLPGITNLSVNINGVYGTLSDYKDDLFIVENISNYSKISINDSVYTSTLGHMNEELYIGKVYKIEDDDISKKVYVKSKVDFNNISYLYVVGE